MLSILHNNLRGQNENGLPTYGNPPMIFKFAADVNRLASELQFVGGHVGLAEFQRIESKDSQQVDPKGIQFLPFTIMREPNERLVSFWAYLNDIQNSSRSIESMLNRMLPNSQYRLLAPLGSNLEDEEATMASIKDSLRSPFALVGLTERFEESLLLLKRRGILEDISFLKHKVLASKRPSFEQIPPATQAKISKHNHLDLELYRFAADLFEETLKEQDDDFWMELKEFKENQQLKIATFGECEDDAVQYGGWLCDDEDRQKHIQRRISRKKEIEERHEEGSDDRVFAEVQKFVRASFTPRYW